MPPAPAQILKADHFPGCQNKKLTPLLDGAPNYRKVSANPSRVATAQRKRVPALSHLHLHAMRRRVPAPVCCTPATHQLAAGGGRRSRACQSMAWPFPPPVACAMCSRRWARLKVRAQATAWQQPAQNTRWHCQARVPPAQPPGTAAAWHACGSGRVPPARSSGVTAAWRARGAGWAPPGGRRHAPPAQPRALASPQAAAACSGTTCGRSLSSTSTASRTWCEQPAGRLPTWSTPASTGAGWRTWRCDTGLALGIHANAAHAAPAGGGCGRGQARGQLGEGRGGGGVMARGCERGPRVLMRSGLLPRRCGVLHAVCMSSPLQVMAARAEHRPSLVRPQGGWSSC
jgi:hypothetical protein